MMRAFLLCESRMVVHKGLILYRVFGWNVFRM